MKSLNIAKYCQASLSTIGFFALQTGAAATTGHSEDIETSSSEPSSILATILILSGAVFGCMVVPFLLAYGCYKVDSKYGCSRQCREGEENYPMVYDIPDPG